jgi:Histidine kinase-, DNA gyrase B-, and HSP90-like ATPase
VQKERQRYEPVNAAPVKSFFVHMLTRDIKLEDAILDLLDNSVDGILRAKAGKKTSGSKTPYAGYQAEIEFAKDSFTISDNCGGIPWNLHDYAFRMGRMPDRSPDAPGSVGVYGIGMKRAIFKMGKRCLISTQSGQNAYDVDINPKWTDDENDWFIPVKPAKRMDGQDGTTLYIGDLYEGIASRFSEDAKAFKTELERMVATNYVFIIDKGFKVKINGDTVKPRPTRLIFDTKVTRTRKEVIRPYIFKARSDGVEVFLAVGFTRPIPSQDEIAEDQEEKKYSSLEAGWTVICNDRAVLYCDRTELTGWGEAGVPRYHTQFIAISGIVEFKADDPSKLPTTTTKRGVDASSTLFLQVKNKMREGMRIFTNYTNKWKTRPEDSKKQIEAGEPLSFEDIKAKSEDLVFGPTKTSLSRGEQFYPELPLPKRLQPNTRRICFNRRVEEVESVAEYLFEEADTDPSEVGEKCFDLMLKEALK